jgi:hypothetical protein
MQLPLETLANEWPQKHLTVPQLLSLVLMLPVLVLSLHLPL